MRSQAFFCLLVIYGRTSPYPSPKIGEGNHEVMGEVNQKKHQK